MSGCVPSLGGLIVETTFTEREFGHTTVEKGLPCLQRFVVSHVSGWMVQCGPSNEVAPCSSMPPSLAVTNSISTCHVSTTGPFLTYLLRSSGKPTFVSGEKRIVNIARVEDVNQRISVAISQGHDVLRMLYDVWVGLDYWVT